MSLHNLKPAAGSTHRKKRLGRGQGSGKAGTSGKGHKGAKSRSGYKRKRAFEGGQMPFQMRVPKRGFNNRNRVAYVPFNLSRLQAIADKHNVKEITVDFLKEQHYIRRGDLVKVLGDGELSVGLTLHVNAASASARTAVENAGGSIEII